MVRIVTESDGRKDLAAVGRCVGVAVRTVFACSFELCIKTKLVFLHSTGHVIICESHCHFRRYFRPLLLLVATTVTTAACLEPPRTERLLPDHFSRKKQATATSAAVAVGEPCQHTPHTHTCTQKHIE